MNEISGTTITYIGDQGWTVHDLTAHRDVYLDISGKCDADAVHTTDDTRWFESGHVEHPVTNSLPAYAMVPVEWSIRQPLQDHNVLFSETRQVIGGGHSRKPGTYNQDIAFPHDLEIVTAVI